MIIYEAHVEMLIKCNYLDLIDHIPKFKRMGITHLQLMPLHTTNGFYGEVWGYSPVDFLSLDKKYGSEDELRFTLSKFKDSDIGVILDVVYNHTGEPMQFDGDWFIKRDGLHTNYSGCGNTFNGCNKDFKKHVLQSLYKLKELGFSGFRFDLAPILAYDENLNYMHDECIIKAIERDCVLKDMVLIAEPWTAFSYNKNTFSDIWFEHNDNIRNSIRKYLRCDDGSRLQLVNAITNSSDKDISFVTCHDGFTLWDLLSYNNKNNWLNGENNNDGCHDNMSNNNGFEGLSADKKINRVRIGKSMIAFTILILCNSNTMILGGDELSRTQHGNNNSYKKIHQLDNNVVYNFSDFIHKLSKIKSSIDINIKPKFMNYKMENISNNLSHHSLMVELQTLDHDKVYILLNPSNVTCQMFLNGNMIVVEANSTVIIE